MNKFSLPEKLIGVGMRFFPGAEALLADVRADTYTPKHIKLEFENNSAGVDNNAIVIRLNNRKIALVRNKDLLEEFGEALNKIAIGTVVPPSVYQLVAIYPNYIVLKLSAPYVLPLMEDFDLISDYKNTYSSTKTSETIKSIKNTVEKKESNKMNISSIKNSFFREVSIAMDIQSGKLGIKTSNGIATFIDGTVNINPITELSFELPGFAVRTDIKDLKAGDIIFNGDTPLFFTGVDEKGTVSGIALTGEVKTISAVSNMFFGKNTVLAIRSMFDGAGMDPMMMALLFNKEGSAFDLKTFALMNMMSGKSDNNNALMMAMLLGK